ncbi:ankyrin repeat domain-containing protein 37 [Astyanax mexicanus]|uniref:Ankyrin repeat domain-containing protein 37 n=1 Tax=Astyanax mexicanus TaxID=7994 RepID=A0A8T2KIM4_ASTMX|nr:ankyrin repeat domain-containing protein 37 [Astyanax mexicanus]
MFLLDSETLFSASTLLESGSAVNGGEDASGQSPAHVAACGGEAFCLLWLLHTGADPNQQDAFGETPVHKAARVGSLECISVLVASDAQLEIRNSEGLTAEDVAWSAGREHCGRLLRTLRNNGRPLTSTGPGRKRALENTSLDAVDGKKARDW